MDEEEFRNNRSVSKSTTVGNGLLRESLWRMYATIREGVVFDEDGYIDISKWLEKIPEKHRARVVEALHKDIFPLFEKRRPSENVLIEMSYAIWRTLRGWFRREDDK
jgi:hypothetical protein